MSEEWVASADWLAEHIDDVAVVDVRDAWEYDGIGHLPDAVNVPFDEFRADGHASQRDAERANGERSDPRADPEGMMPERDHWAALLSEAGIERGDTIVAYDDTHGVFAARFLVTALYYGHDDLRLFDGDYSAWLRDHETTDEAPDVTPTDYQPGDPDESVFVDADDVLAATDDPDAVVVDTREPEEYAEGHIPGAVNLDWKEVVDDETRGLKPRGEIESLLAERGVTPDERVVLYCNTARRISHTFVVLRWLGFPDVAFYEGSLTDWTERGHPVE
ncbi:MULTISPECIES: sulfurtransferase [Halobacterium]|uniref:sulfurtransferase n=1 Tax=Halobacterium TaxID=2239 RepID=UPI00073EE687|nr:MULTISPECIES: sulfurtransferase [Halobacterium]MCG1004544.1 sulfurtransferase [Halobacterium noricense]